MNPESENPQHQAATFNGALCWEVAGKTGTSYIFGSIHQMDSRRISLPLDRLEQLLRSTRGLVVEVDLSDIPQPETAPVHQGGADHDLAALLGETRRLRLMEILSEHQDLHTIPLPLLTLLVTMKTQLSSELFGTADLEVETHFTQVAKNHGLSVHQLETFEEQLALLATDVPKHEQVAELIKAIRVHDDPAMPDMFARYADQDLRLLPESEFAAGPMVERNLRLTERLVTLIESQPVFAIVGAAHLPQETGMLALLAKRGYTVTPHPLTVTVN